MPKFFEKYKPRYIFLGLLVAAVILVWSAVFYLERDTLLVAFLDVGQGDAIFIESPSGTQILIDGGPNKKIIQELSKVLPFYDRAIDALILTHPQKDHIGGLVEVLKRYDIDFVFEPGTRHSIAEFSEWERLIAEKDIARIFARRGTRIWLSDDIYFDILSPNEIQEVSSKNLNEVMIVGKLVYGQNEFLLTGDLTRGGEFKLIFSGDDLQSDVLKVGHHGSKNSSSDEFLKKVSPETVVIMSGKSNPYGHPHQETLSKFQAAGIKIFRTDTDGAIIFESDGKNINLR